MVDKELLYAILYGKYTHYSADFYITYKVKKEAPIDIKQTNYSVKVDIKPLLVDTQSIDRTKRHIAKSIAKRMDDLLLKSIVGNEYVPENTILIQNYDKANWITYKVLKDRKEPDTRSSWFRVFDTYDVWKWEDNYTPTIVRPYVLDYDKLWKKRNDIAVDIIHYTTLGDYSAICLLSSTEEPEFKFWRYRTGTTILDFKYHRFNSFEDFKDMVVADE